MRFGQSNQLRPPPEPVQSNERGAVWVGIALWVIVLALVLWQRQPLIEQGRGWWVWTPIYGIVLGLAGIRWLSRRGR